MSGGLRLPNITEKTTEGQLRQMQSYLFQTAQYLNWALGNVQSSGTAGATSAAASKSSSSPQEEAAATFNEIKSLIIKSADIVNAYYETINARLQGLYVAQSDFGTYSEQTAQEIEANSTSIEQLFTNLQTISDTVDGISNATIRADAYLRSGLLYYGEDGAPVYGLEIGQTNTVDGEETFDKFARFTSDRLSFYDRNDVEVAYISDYKLFITNAEVTGKFTLGEYILDTSDGIAFT